MVAHANVALRYTLGILLGFIALNAFGGGAYGIAGAEDVPRAWLEGSPFRDYLIPSVFLLLIVGGSAWLATIALFADWSNARVLTLTAAGVVLAWIVAQVAIIGYVSPLQPLVAITALLIGAAAQFLNADVAGSGGHRFSH
jgi:hypothetical protein